MKRLILSIAALITIPFPVTGQSLNPAYLLNPPPDTWPTFNGDYTGQRHSKFTQINASNVKSLALVWAGRVDFGTASGAQQESEGRRFKASPLLVDGILYFTITDNVWAMDARSGRVIWHYAWPPNNAVHVANRGLGMYGSWLYFMTPDDYLVSLNSKDGSERWRVQIADVKQDFFSATAPLVIGNHVIIGPGNNDDIRAWLESRDPVTGALQWKWYVDPDPGAPGSETWSDNETMAKGGGFPWVNGTYDPKLNLLYFGTGNGVPEDRPPHPTPKGDSLYTSSLIALNPDTGKMAWAYQLTPHDVWDYDSAHTPIIFDAVINGKPRKLVEMLPKNGYYFLFDRVTGEHLVTAKFMPETNWAKGLDGEGRPVPDYSKDPNPAGALVSPYPLGVTNWWAPSYDPKRGLLFVNAARTWEFFATDGYAPFRFQPEYRTEAIDYKTGKIVWSHDLGNESSVLISGLLSTDGNLLFSGDSAGNFLAMDPSTGKTLWHVGLGQFVTNAPITYELDGRQFILVAANDTFYAFALPEASGSPPAPAHK